LDNLVSGDVTLVTPANASRYLARMDWREGGNEAASKRLTALIAVLEPNLKSPPPLLRRLYEQVTYELICSLQRERRFDEAKALYTRLMNQFPDNDLCYSANCGVFVYDGYYVFPPYEVWIAGEAVLVNGIIVHQVKAKAVTAREELMAAPLIEVPATGKGFGDSRITDATLQRWDLWARDYGMEKAKEMLSDYLRKQPVVASFKWSDSGFSLSLQDKTGFSVTFLLEPPETPEDKQYRLARPARVRKQFADRLQKTFSLGQLTFLWAKGGQVSVPQPRPWLGQLFGILTTDVEVVEKVKRIREAGMLTNDDSAKSVVERLGPVNVLRQNLVPDQKRPD
jgi:hypothetical protein